MSIFDRFRKRKAGEEPEQPRLGLPDPSDDWTPPEFVEAVKSMAADDRPTARAEFHRQLLGMQLWIPAAMEHGSSVAQFPGTATESGEMAIVAFTDMAALVRWQPDPVSVLCFPGDKFFESVLTTAAAEAWINPAGFAGGRIFRHEMEALAQGRLPQYESSLNNVKSMDICGYDREPPAEHLARIRAAFVGNDRVLEVYWAGLSINEEEPFPVVGVWAGEFSTEVEREALHQELERILNLDPSNRLPVLVMEDAEIREYWLKPGFRVAL